jgi:nicotinamidase-related amidase
VNGLYKPVIEGLNRRIEDYLLALENRGRYNLCIWPPHCLTATWGYCVEEQVWNAAHQWEISHLGKNVDFIRKAVNPLTEHYSAIQAEVPDPADVTTRVNFDFIDKIKEFEHIIIAGEALSHCVANTVRDLSVYIPPYRMIVLTDCTSNVTGFEKVGNDFIDEFRTKGVQFIDSKSLILE